MPDSPDTGTPTPDSPASAPSRDNPAAQPSTPALDDLGGTLAADASAALTPVDPAAASAAASAALALTSATGIDQYRWMVPLEEELEVMRLYHSGYRFSDICVKTGIAYDRVRRAYKRAIKRAEKIVTPEESRMEQYLTLLAVKDRFIEQVLPPRNADGTAPHINPKDVDAFMKLMNGMAGLTGSRQPAKLIIEGDVTHHESQQAVERAEEYRRVIDLVVKMGYTGLPTIDVEAITDGELVPPLSDGATDSSIDGEPPS